MHNTFWDYFCCGGLFSPHSLSFLSSSPAFVIHTWAFVTEFCLKQLLHALACHLVSHEAKFVIICDALPLLPPPYPLNISLTFGVTVAVPAEKHLVRCVFFQDLLTSLSSISPTLTRRFRSEKKPRAMKKPRANR